MVGQLADDCSVRPGSKRFEWNQDAFIFEAFKQCTMMLLEEIRPRQSDVKKHLSSDASIHEAWREMLASPDELAKHIFLGLWEDLHRIERTSVEQAKSDLNVDKKTAGVWSRWTYTLADVRRDLRIGEKKR